MKKLALLVALALTSLTAMAAKSTVNLENVTDAAAQPIYYLNTGTLAVTSANTFIQVWGAPQGGTLAPLTDANGAAITLTMGFGGAGDGYFFGPGGAIPGSAGGGAVDLQVVAWKGATTFDAAPFQGKSGKWTQTGAGSWPENAQVPIDGPGLQMPAFTITAAVVPEPSTIALGLLGAATLLLRRRS